MIDALPIRLGAALLLLASAVLGDTWTVDSSAPCPGQGTAVAPFCRIQLAIDAAADGDTVRVSPGTYLENIDFLGKAIRVFASADATQTILDGQQAGSCVVFRNGEGSAASLEGFTIRNGSAPAGGGILIENASPVILGNIIVLNRGFDGAGVAVLGGKPLIDGNRIEDNWAISGVGGGLLLNGDATARDNVIRANRASGFSAGGGVACQSGSPTIEGNVLEGNRAAAGAGIFIDGAGGVVLRNDIRGNIADSEGGGLFLGDTQASVVLNRIHGNRAARGAGVNCGLQCRSVLTSNLIARNGDGATSQGGGVRCSASSNPALVNCTFFGNVATHGGGLWNSGTTVVANSILWADTGELVTVGGTLTVGASIIQGGWPGVGNLSSDPRFLAPPRDDFRLSCDSPAIDAGIQSPLLSPVDLEGDLRVVDGDSDGNAAVDLGADELDFLWFPEGPLQVGAPIAFRAMAPPVHQGQAALLFLSLGDGTVSGGVPLPGGFTLELDPDGLFQYTQSWPAPLRSAPITPCPGTVTQPVTIPPSAPIGLRVFYAGALLGPGPSIVTVTPTQSFTLR
ncbi:MAG: right-handed parallel beta-helix repeat-containing protein [Planctomycetota bacterium]